MPEKAVSMSICMVDLSVAVCHVPHVDPKRDSLVRRLRKQYPDLSVIRDIDREGCWPTSLKATRAISPGATHHMVLHDHAYIPNPDALMAAIEARPDSWIAPLDVSDRQSRLDPNP